MDGDKNNNSSSFTFEKINEKNYFVMSKNTIEKFPVIIRWENLSLIYSGCVDFNKAVYTVIN